MIKIHLIFTTVFLATSFHVTPSIATQQLTTSSLFNGKNLSGWNSLGTEQWYVEDDLLVCENGEDNDFGYLVTDKHYKNFELTLEYKQEKRGNSGIFVRSTAQGTSIRGWQVEVAPPGHSTGGVHQYQRGWLIKPDLEKDKAIKMGECNTMKRDILTSWLNGIQMTTITNEQLGNGVGGIALQTHGSK